MSINDHSKPTDIPVHIHVHFKSVNDHCKPTDMPVNILFTVF